MPETRQPTTLIVGAGPAGLSAGIAALRARPGSEVRILERNARPGVKLLLSGSGQCNVTHAGTVEDFLAHYGGVKKARFVKPVLTAFDNEAVKRFFERLGVPLSEREDGKIFPRSLKSRDLLDALVREFENRGGMLQTGAVVESVHRTGEGFLLKGNSGSESQGSRWTAEILVLAAGGASYPATGSRGDGFRWAESLGHRIVPPRPALTPLYVRDFAFGELAGIALRQAAIDVRRGDRRVATNRGDVLLTHHGLSGPGILDLSRSVAPGDTVHVALTSHARRLPELLTGKKTLRNTLAPLELAERLLLRLLETLEIRPACPAAEVTREQRKHLEAALDGFPFIVERLGGWKEAMVTAGGVALEEVDRRTMQSRLVPNLFFAGEILDIDGDTGGYNIQFALSSGGMGRVKSEE